jgi:hypothetical protein
MNNIKEFSGCVVTYGAQKIENTSAVIIVPTETENIKDLTTTTCIKVKIPKGAWSDVDLKLELNLNELRDVPKRHAFFSLIVVLYPTCARFPREKTSVNHETSSYTIELKNPTRGDALIVTLTDLGLPMPPLSMEFDEDDTFAY